MTPEKRKDNLTDLANDVSSDTSQPTAQMSDGQVTANDNTVVTLGFKKKIDSLARELLDVVKKKKE